jgi:hypothetical protein
MSSRSDLDSAARDLSFSFYILYTPTFRQDEQTEYHQSDEFMHFGHCYNFRTYKLGIGRISKHLCDQQ